MQKITGTAADFPCNFEFTPEPINATTSSSTSCSHRKLAQGGIVSLHGTRLTRDPNQTVHFFGLSYFYRFQ